MSSWPGGSAGPDGDCWGDPRGSHETDPFGSRSERWMSFLKGFSPFLGRMPMARPVEGIEEFMPLADIVEREKE